MSNKSIGNEPVYDARTLGAPRMFVLGLQHMFAMFGATVLVPALSGLDVATTLLFAGLGTLLFHLLTKGKVPAFLGSSFAFLGGYAAVAPLIDGKTPNLEMLPYACFGVACAGLVYVILSALFKAFGAKKVMRFFPPIVTGPIIILIGLNLSGTAIGNASTNWWLALVAIAVIISAFNGFGMAKLHMHPFIVTLSTQLLIYGVIIWFFSLNGNNSQPISSLSQQYKDFVGGTMFRLGNIAIPWYVLYAVIITVIMWFIWNKTVFGKNMFAVGSNADAAKVSGVNVFLTTMMVHALAGAMYGYSGYIEAVRVGTVAMNTGLNAECDAIAACVIGGVSFVGGTGKISGIILGVVVLRLIFVALTMLGVDSSSLYIIKGAIILVAVSLDMRKYLVKK